MKRLFFFILVLIFFQQSFGQESIKNWKRYEFPNDSLALKFNFFDRTFDKFCFIHSNNLGEIIAQDTNLHQLITDSLPFPSPLDTLRPTCGGWGGPTIVKKVQNGYLVAGGRILLWLSNKGDSLYFISGGNNKRAMEYRGSVHRIFEYNGKIYLAGGGWRDGDKGEIEEMGFVNDKWVISSTIQLPSSPQIVLPYDKGMVVIMLDAIQIFDENFLLRAIGKYGFMFKFPRSAVIKDDDLYIGMRGGVYKVNLKSGIEEWYRSN